MSETEIQVYLSEALDQEACKATLIAALESRVCSLQDLGISNREIINSLENLCDDPYQINDDVIFVVIENLVIGEI